MDTMRNEEVNGKVGIRETLSDGGDRKKLKGFGYQ